MTDKFWVRNQVDVLSRLIWQVRLTREGDMWSGEAPCKPGDRYRSGFCAEGLEALALALQASINVTMVCCFGLKRLVLCGAATCAAMGKKSLGLCESQLESCALPAWLIY